MAPADSQTGQTVNIKEQQQQQQLTTATDSSFSFPAALQSEQRHVVYKDENPELGWATSHLDLHPKSEAGPPRRA